MKIIFILILFFFVYNTFILAIDPKWNIESPNSSEGFKLFSDSLKNVLEILLKNKRDLVITTGGRKSSDKFTNNILLPLHGNNAIIFFSYRYMINNLKTFERLLIPHEYNILILSDRDDSNLIEFLDVLNHQKVKIVIGFYNGVSDVFLQAVIEKCFQEGLLQTIAIVNSHSSVKIIEGEYFTNSSCKTEIILNEVNLSLRNSSNLSNIFTAKKIIDMKGCELNISTISIPPNVIVNLTRGNPVSGFETHIIELLGKDMNFTPNIKVFPNLIWGGKSENGTGVGFLGEVLVGRSEIAYGVIWPTHDRKALFDLSLPYENDCFGWAVPKGAQPSLHRALTGYLIDGFKTWSWVCIIISAVCMCLFYCLYNFLLGRPDRSTFEAFVVGFLVTISLLVQKAAYKSYIFPHLSMRIIFVTWLFYTLVISTIYSGVLSEQLTIPDVHPDLNTLEELLESQLPLVTSKDVYRSIHNIDSNETLYNMVKRRIEVRTPSREQIPKIIAGHKFAYCRNLETLHYYRNQILAKNGHLGNGFHIMKDCFMTYPLVIVLRKGSALTQRTNEVISRLVETGLLGHWKHRREEITKLLRSFEPEKFGKLRYIFYFYGIGISLAAIVFVFEVIYYHCSEKKKKEKREFYFDFKN